MAGGAGETVFDVAGPAWAVQYDVRGQASGPRHRSTVAQHPQRAMIFEEIPNGAVTLDGGLVLCRVQVTAGHPWDSRGVFGRHVDPDITYRISVGDALVTARGAEDARSAVIAIPGLSLGSGAAISIRAVDRDVGRDDDMGTAELPFAGTSPFVGTSDGPGALQYECRAATREWAEARALSHFANSDGPLTTLKNAHPNLAEGLVELDAAPLERAYEPLFGAAALLGWGHPAIRDRLAILDGAAERHREELAIQVAAAADQLPAPGSPSELTGGGQVRIREAGCSAERTTALGLAGPCHLVLEMMVSGGGPDALVPRVSLIDGTGAQSVVQPAAVEVGGQRQNQTIHVPAGTLAAILYELEASALVQEPAPPVALVSTGSDRVVLRLF